MKVESDGSAGAGAQQQAREQVEYSSVVIQFKDGATVEMGRSKYVVAEEPKGGRTLIAQALDTGEIVLADMESVSYLRVRPALVRAVRGGKAG